MTDPKGSLTEKPIQPSSHIQPNSSIIDSMAPRTHSLKTQAALIIAANALALACLLVAFRSAILRSDLAGADPSDQLALLSHGPLQDMLFVSVVGAIALLASQLVRPLRVARAFRWLCAIFVLWGASNVVAMGLLAEPVTWAWITYADIFNSTYAFDAIFHLVDLKFAGILVAILLVFLALQYLLTIIISRIRATMRASALAIALPALTWMGLTSINPDTDLLSRGERLNPVFALAQSVIAPPRWGVDLIDKGDDASIPPPPDVAFSAPIERPDTDRHPIRNVILFVLESTPSRFVEDYGSPYPVTPNLTRYSDQALRIARVYSPTPASNYGLFSLTTSVVPEMKAVSPQQEHPGRDYLALGDVLKRAGFRTGFFASTDNRFDRREEYLPFAGYDTVEDYRDWSCDAGFFGTSGPGYHNTGPDRCTVAPVLDWIDNAPAKPFFATFWTGQPHYPYFVEGEPVAYSGNEDRDRFLSAVADADRAFGLLMDGLAQRNLLDETLVVVVGDHGEAFGEHGTYGHAPSVYEENLRVPLYFISSKHFDGQYADRLAVTTDVAPTILDLLGLPRPGIWQGQSLFSDQHRDGTIFFSPWNGFLTGFVEGHTKVIYNASTEQIELFDLSQDPQERQNLASERPEQVEVYRDKLAQWLTWQSAISSRYALALTDQAPTTGEEPRRISLYATGTYFQNYPRAKVYIDDQVVGVVQVSAAPSNAEQKISQKQQNDALRQYFIDNTGDRCGRKLSVLFENDEWAGENLTGDTNLTVKWIEVDGIYYMGEQFRLETDGAGSYWQDAFTMWRNGTFSVDLAPPSDCISTSLVHQND